MRASLVALATGFALKGDPAAAACVGGPLVFTCSGADAAPAAAQITALAPTYNLVGETITGAGGPGIVIQSTDSNAAHTGGYTMDSASSISVTGVLARGLWYETTGAGLTVSIAGPITTVGGNSILAEIDTPGSTAPVSITTLAGAPVVGRISGGNFGAGNVTIITGDSVTFAVGLGGTTEGSSAIDGDSFGGHVQITANAKVTSFFDGISSGDGLNSNVDIITGVNAPITAGRFGILAQMVAASNGHIDIVTNAPVTTTGAVANSSSIFALGDTGNVSITNNAPVGTFGIKAITAGTGTVTVNANANVVGNAAPGAINASSVNGLLTVVLSNGATVSAGNPAADALHLVNTGSGGIAATTGVGTMVTGQGSGIFESLTSASTTVTNNGTVTGAGSIAKPVISIAGGSTFLATLNNNGSILSLAGLPGDLAVNESSSALTVNNTGLLTGRLAAADTLLGNTNTWTVFGSNTFGAAAINNPGALVIAGSPGNGGSGTSFTASGVETVNNTGLVFVNGAASFTGAAGSAFNNAGGLIDMRQGVAGDVMTVGGNFAGSANSRLGVDTFLGGAGSRSDQLFIGGSAAGSTSIIVHDVNPGAGGFTGLGGIPIVTVTGASTPTSFTLSPASTVIGGTYLPIGSGVLRKGLFDYTLVDDPGVFALVSVPNASLSQMPVALTAAQTIWYETAFAWEDRQTQLRDFFHRGAAPADRIAMPLKAPTPTPAAASQPPGIWLQAVGSRTNRSDLADFAAGGTTFPVDLGYKQNIFGLIGGIDGGREKVLSRNDAIFLGLMGGYLNSSLTFNANPMTFGNSGGTAGASATYLNNGFFADALVKADALRLDLGGLPVQAGTPGTAVDTLTLGAWGDMGYHFDWRSLFIEPLGTLAFTHTAIDEVSLPAAGVAVDFNKAETFRGALGARLGGRIAENPASALDASVVVRLWDQFSGNNAATIVNSGLPLVLTDTFTGTFGEVTGHLDWIRRGGGLSAFLAGGVKFNRDFTTTNIKGGVRYQF